MDFDAKYTNLIERIDKIIYSDYNPKILQNYIKEYKIPIKFISYGYSTRDLIGNSQQVLKYNANISFGNLQAIYYTSSTITTEPAFLYLAIEKATSSNFANNVLLFK